MSWQRCPICGGTGVESQAPAPSNATAIEVKFPAPCTVCRGKKIISEINGLPPDGPGLTITY